MNKLTVLAEFETAGASFLVSDATILQCLQVAIQEGRLPPVSEDWLCRARGDVRCVERLGETAAGVLWARRD